MDQTMDSANPKPIKIEVGFILHKRRIESGVSS